MPRPVPAAAFRHRPALDALRGLAVLVVVAFHSELGFAKGGYLGVSTFFTLSGFLIATLLLVEHGSTGRIDLRAFWRRRFRRLLPAAIVAVALVVALVALVGPASAKESVGGDATASVLYVANWHLLWSGTSYAALFTDPSPLVHTWSLAVEEQFYVVFPLLVVALVGRSSRPAARARLGLAAAATVVVSAALPVLFGFGADRTYYGTDTRAAEIALGVLLAVIALPTAAPASGASGERRLRRPVRVAIAVASTVAFVAMAVTWVGVPETAAAWRHGGLALYGLGSAALVAAAVYSVGPVGLLGKLRPLCRLGVVSYAVYLLHWPVLWVIGLETDWAPPVRFVVALAVSVALAELSLRAFEMPIRRTGRVAGASAVPAVASVAVLALVGASFVSHSAPPPVIDYAAAAAVVEAPAAGDGVASTPSTGADTAATVGGVSAPAPVRVAFFGDSTALMTAAGFKTATEGDPRVVEVPGATALGCGIMLADQVRDERGTVGAIADKCVRWPEVWPAQVDANRPDVAIVQAGPWETWDMRWAGVDGWHHLGDPVADADARSLLQQAVDGLASRGAHVALVTSPHVDRRPAGPGPCACSDRIDRWNELLQEVADANPGTVSVIDLAGWLASLGDEDVRLRPDGVHFSEATATEVAQRWLVDQVVALPTATARGPAATTSG
jgi:peptidoglycan/LPS O-acetylase OafA/YrhL